MTTKLNQRLIEPVSLLIVCFLTFYILLISEPKPKILDNLISSFKSPSIRNKKINTDDYFLASLSTDYEGTRHPDAGKFAVKGIKNKKLREELTDKIFEILKRRCFDNHVSCFLLTRGLLQ